jgi:hypothetical protein
MKYGVALALLACSTRENAQVRSVSAPRLKCPAQEIEMVVNRETPKVREWVAACDFMYTRVHCTERGCYAAPTKPPCIGDMPCFEEDPVTLQWNLASAQAP